MGSGSMELEMLGTFIFRNFNALLSIALTFPSRLVIFVRTGLTSLARGAASTTPPFSSTSLELGIATPAPPLGLIVVLLSIS